MKAADLETLREQWLAAWPAALATWSPLTRLRAPQLLLTAEDERREGLTGSFAAIRLVDQTVMISLRQVAPHLSGFAREVLAHEIGHHILCPADLADNARMLARIRRALPTVEAQAPMIGNLYADLLINDRLQRSRGLDMAGVYRAIDEPDQQQSPLWTFYVRIYELLWSLERGTLARQDGLTDRIEGDAVLGARLVRVFATRWLEGAGRFGALCLPYLMDAAADDAAVRRWADTTGAGTGGVPDGLTEIDGDEGADPLHPSLDPALGGTPSAPAATGTATGAPGQYRQPFEYGEILRATGLSISDQEVAVRYYRERAARHLIPFPTRRVPQVTDPLPEGVEPWDVGSPLADVDWMQTALRSPVVIPGATTVQRVWGTSAGAEPDRVPLDLDLYVDSSASMPDPRVTISQLALAGAIVALSALRAGASVQATLWSGPEEFAVTPGFVRDETAVLRVLTGFIGGSTAFPIHVVRDTYAKREPNAPPAHVLVVSDDGVTTMFDTDERGAGGREVINHALGLARGGATMVLNLWGSLEENPQLVQARDDGWDIHVVRTWEDLVVFARAFSRRTYE